MSLSSQPVSNWLASKSPVSISVMRYSSVVRKSPLMDTSFKAYTMFLHTHNTGTVQRIVKHLQPSHKLSHPTSLSRPTSLSHSTSSHPTSSPSHPTLTS